jgi:hypothetical protein
MASIYHIVAIRVNETSWAHAWRLHIHYLGMGCDNNCRSVIDEKHTNDHIWSFLGFLHCDVIDLSTNIVLSSSNRNRISPTGRCRGGHGCLRRAVALAGALVGKVTFVPTSEAPPFTL